MMDPDEQSELAWRMQNSVATTCGAVTLKHPLQGKRRYYLPSAGKMTAAFPSPAPP